MKISDRIKQFSDEQVGRAAIGIILLLTAVFIGLKVSGYITWSWFWVLSPTILFPISVVALFVLVILVIAAVITFPLAPIIYKYLRKRATKLWETINDNN